jgi:cytochrome P450
MLPPGPATGPLAQTIALHRDPLGMLEAARAAHGDVFTLRLATARPLVVVAAAAAVPALLDADPATARAGEPRRRILPAASPRSVFGGDGAAHATARGHIAGALSPEVVARRRDAMEALATAHADRWPQGRPFRLLPRIRALVDDVFVRCILRSDDERLAPAIRRMLWTPGNPPFSLPGDGLLGAAARPFYRRRTAPVATLLAAELERRGDVLDRLAAELEHRDGDDILGGMAGQPVPGAVDELLSTLMAAQEPPAAALTWLLERLARAPELADAYVADPASRDPVVREVLRVRAPALAALRRLTTPRDVAGHALPAGVSVMLPTPLLHRDPAAFPDPECFDPARWIGAPPEATYLPFGGGARRCVGEALAHAYFDVLVPAVLRRLRLRPVLREPERMVLRGTILVPHRSALVRAQRFGA